MTTLPTTVQQDPHAIDEETERFLRADAIVDAINAAVPNTLPPIPKEYMFRKRDAGVVSLALNSAFENIGGVPRLVATAAADPKWFYGIWAKQLGLEAAGHTATGINITFNTAIPETSLDRVNVDQDGNVFVEAEVADDELPE